VHRSHDRLRACAVAATVAIALGGGCDTFSPRGCVGLSQGTLVVAPGMSIDDAQRKSSLPLSSIWTDQDGARWATTKEVPLLFDARIAGTALHFERCVYHVVETLRGGSAVVHRVQLDRESVGWDEARRQVLSLRNALLHDGWRLPAGEAELGKEGSLMQGFELGAWRKADWFVKVSETRDFHADDHADDRDVLWQQELTFLLRDP
jgi:hypothetical protein